MTTPYDPHRVPHQGPAAPNRHGSPGRSSGHGWMMIACCIPMLVIATVLVATGAAGIGFLLAAIMCTAMMALMMAGMSSHHPS